MFLQAAIAVLQYLGLYDKLHYIFGATVLIFLFFEARRR